MRSQRLALLAFCAALAPVRPADSPAGVKVMTFNIQHGIDGSHKYNLQRAIDAIAKVQPDLVGAAGGHAQPSVLQLRRSAGAHRRGAEGGDRT